jgi:Domain of unknown function (DUF4982)
MSYYRETVFGLRDAPYLAVHRPEFHGQATFQTPWSWADAVSSWSFDVPAGSPVTIDVYSDADEIELTLNGTPIGRASVGKEKACRPDQGGWHGHRPNAVSALDTPNYLRKQQRRLPCRSTYSSSPSSPHLTC